MKIVTIQKKYLRQYTVDKEMMQKAGRPCALIIRLKYRGQRYDFAIPLRSNINASVPKNQYFPLPPRSTTRSGNRHGVHYTKMFPIDKSIANRYRTEGNAFATLVKKILDKNEKQIVSECQYYLNEYEKGNKPLYSTDIDLLIQVMSNIKK